jgi:hypothetical protein
MIAALLRMIGGPEIIPFQRAPLEIKTGRSVRKNRSLPDFFA